MKFITQLIGQLIGLTTIGTLLTGMPVRSQSVNPDSVKKLAGQYTVRIRSTAAEPGSGVIIARQGNRYTVLTAAHVLGTLNTQSNSVCAFLRTHDSQNHQITLKNSRLLPDNDLAIVEFETTRDYPTATLSTYQYPLRDQRNYQSTNSAAENQESSKDYDRLTINQDYRKKFAAFTLGYPNLKEADNPLDCSQAASTQDMGSTDLSVSAGQLVDMSGTAITNPEARYRNYEMVYTNMTYVGMSGGPIVDPNGRVVGIHGRSDGKTLDSSLKNVIKEYNPEVDAKEDVRFRLGMSLGVPLSTVLRLAPGLRLQPSSLTLSSQAPNTPDVNPTEWLESNDFRKYNNYEQSPLYWLERGNHQWRISQIDAAQQSFDRALELDQKQRGVLQHYAYFMKGFAYAQAQQHEKALANCIKSTEMVQGKEFYDAWRCQASEYAYLKQFPEATAALNKAIDLRKRVANSGEQGKAENQGKRTLNGSLEHRFIRLLLG
jgi:tetratricopeptide (TPR) repeat protein